MARARNLPAVHKASGPGGLTGGPTTGPGLCFSPVCAWGCARSPVRGGSNAVEVPFQPFPCPGSQPGSGEISERGQRPDCWQRTDWVELPKPLTRGSLSSEFGSHGKQVQTTGQEVFRCPFSWWRAPWGSGPERPGRLREVQAPQDPLQQVGSGGC